MTDRVNVRNILVGAGDLFYTDDRLAGTPTVDFPTFNTGSTSLRDDFHTDSEWHYAGATQDGVELTYTPDYGEVEVDQMKGAAVMFNQNLTVTLGTNLVEAALESLLLAWGMADDYLSQAGETDQFQLGVPGDDPAERSIAVVGKGTPVETGVAPDTEWVRRDRAYLARRVVSVEGSTVALRRTEATTFPVSFRLLPDTDNKDSEYGVIVDRVPGDSAPNPSLNNEIT